MNLDQLATAIKASKRLGGKPSVQLTRHYNALWYLKNWQRKERLAKTKVKYYRRRVRYYDKRLGGQS